VQALEQALAFYRDMGDRLGHWDEAHALAGLGRCALAHGRTSDQRRHREPQTGAGHFRKIGAAETAEITAE
jgi:hypothetical protein